MLVVSVTTFFLALCAAAVPVSGKLKAGDCELKTFTKAEARHAKEKILSDMLDHEIAVTCYVPSVKKLIGALVYHTIREHDYYVSHVEVDKEHRNGRIGTWLMQQLYNIIHRRSGTNKGHIYLVPAPEEGMAQKLECWYTNKCGFQKTGEAMELEFGPDKPLPRLM